MAKKISFKLKPLTKNNIWEYLFYFLSAISLILLLTLSQDAGISGDEFYHYEQAENVYKYYASCGEDSTAAVITEKYNLPYYGQSIDNLAYFITKTFNIDNYMEFRHSLNSFMGWLAILFLGLLIKRIAGWRAGVFAIILMMVSPRFIGHSFNNLKDLPLATATIMSIYYIVKFLDSLPKIRISTAIMLSFSIALAISIRVGGLIVIGYFALFALVYYFWKQKSLKKEFLRVFLWGIAIVIVGYFAAILSWPFGMKAPIDNTKETLDSMTKFAIAIRQIYEGSSQWSDILPWYYTPKFILTTVPLVVLAGALLGVIFMFKDKEKWFYYFVLVFSFVFPIFWIVINNSNVYGGWRHAIFAYPPLVGLAALGIDYFKKGKLQIIILSAFGLLTIPPIYHIVKNHPYEYVYFNELSGGMEKAYGNYELDYYYHSLREASLWVIDNAQKDSLTLGDKIVVACWHPKPIQYYLRKDTAKFETAFIRYNERGESNWDYAIISNTGIYPEQLRNGTFPPKNTVKEILVDGKPICIVVKRTNKDDFKATQLKNQGLVDEAIPYYQSAIRADGKNETALINLGEIYLRKNNFDSVIMLMDNLLSFSPKAENANYFKAYALMGKKEYDKAIDICNKIIKDNFKYQGAYSLAANIKLQQQDLVGAEGYLNGLIDIERYDNQTIQQLLAIYRAYGLDERNSYVKLYSLLSKHYEEKGNEKAAEEYRNAIKQIYNNR
ncbi:MAG: phospholipid carrier-dependent glycosyltransferase [Bacteroidales bacterium]|jgi:tetratricopeptide (TPR) repeat protein|nr:phospholipid carrier-dependent glycosyltransferase [Bacteroidales bacterium]